MKQKLAAAFTLVLALGAGNLAAAPLDGSFHFQASGLKPGPHYLQFQLYDSPSATSPVAYSVPAGGQLVTADANGIYTVDVLFTWTIFTANQAAPLGNQYWLEVVEYDGAIDDFPLAPPPHQQKLVAVPYALYASKAKTAEGLIDGAVISGSVNFSAGATITGEATFTGGLSVQAGWGSFGGGLYAVGAEFVGETDFYGNAWLNDNDLYLRHTGDQETPTDTHHGLGYYGWGKPWAGFSGDGPVLYGWAGGALGTTANGQATALAWNNGGDVAVTRDVKVGRSLVVASDMYAGGNASVCSLTIRGGCDLAEPFQISGQNISKGTVVVIDDEHPGQLKMSDRPYDTRVAGIISGANGINTGIALHQEGRLEGGENVALSGRVYVLADALGGPIKPGDLLTTSSTPGHAMKVADHAKAQGAVLGKAMSALPEGKAMVLVLVSLQ